MNGSPVPESCKEKIRQLLLDGQMSYGRIHERVTYRADGRVKHVSIPGIGLIRQEMGLPITPRGKHNRGPGIGVRRRRMSSERELDICVDCALLNQCPIEMKGDFWIAECNQFMEKV